jgi:hypothetical protein
VFPGQGYYLGFEFLGVHPPFFVSLSPLFLLIGYTSRLSLCLPVGLRATALDPAKQERYKIRTTVERVNAHLKDSLIRRSIYVKGYKKVSFVLMAVALCLVALKYLQLFIWGFWNRLNSNKFNRGEPGSRRLPWVWTPPSSQQPRPEGRSMLFR